MGVAFWWESYNAPVGRASVPRLVEARRRMCRWVSTIGLRSASAFGQLQCLRRSCISSSSVWVTALPRMRSR